MSATRSITRLAVASRLATHSVPHSTRLSSCSASSFSPSSSCRSPPSSLFVPCAGLSTYSDYGNTTSTISHRPDALDPTRFLSRRQSSALTEIESKGSVLDLYRKICRLLPQVLKAYELQGEDSYHRALRNLRFYFENHRELRDSNVIEVLRHKAEMEIEEAMLMSATHTPTHSLTAHSSTQHGTAHSALLSHAISAVSNRRRWWRYVPH